MNTKIIPLGGMGEVGKNMYVVMHDDEIIIVDSGVMFPDDDLLGIDYVIQDYTFLKENESKIKALIITHGHEDHIGSIPFLLQSVTIPKIYAPSNAKELIDKKLEERTIVYKDMVIYDEDTVIKTKHFNIEFFRTTHSIPDSHGLAIDTPDGVIVMTGDFKFDMTPIGPMANLHKMARIGEKGVSVLMSDSTNAMSPGTSLSESVVDENLKEIFSTYTSNRIILATFASNVYRIKHIIETCKKKNNRKKLLLFGRSMENMVDIALKCGYFEDKSIIITAEEANHLKPGEVCLLCTGSQGEPLAALSRIAAGTHRQISLMPNDIVIFSSSPIPGNTASVSKTINKLYKKGVKVFTNAMSEIHSSGHANQDELKLMIRLFKPKYFVPYHGEFRMLKKHTDLGVMCDVPRRNTFVLENGDVLALEKGNLRRDGKVQAGEVYVDGSRIGDVGSAVIKDRILMSTNGILVIIANIDMQKKILMGSPAITTRGYILVNENTDLIRDIQHNAEIIINKELKKKVFNFNDMKSEIINGLIPMLSDKTGRVPIILPIVMGIKSDNDESSTEENNKVKQ
ncbi:MAG: ribonuclease J [Bacilli bacterium]|nr:MAG: ribonuclease J [Bacilli bacterium]